MKHKTKSLKRVIFYSLTFSQIWQLSWYYVRRKFTGFHMIICCFFFQRIWFVMYRCCFPLNILKLALLQPLVIYKVDDSPSEAVVLFHNCATDQRNRCKFRHPWGRGMIVFWSGYQVTLVWLKVSFLAPKLLAYCVVPKYVHWTQNRHPDLSGCDWLQFPTKFPPPKF